MELNKTTLNLILKKHGFTKIKKHLRQTAKNQILVAQKDKKDYFIKITADPEHFSNLINEVEANKFINRTKPDDLLFSTPEAKLVKNKNYCLGIFEFIKGQNLADQSSLKINYQPTDKEMEELFQIQAFFYQVKKNELTKYFIETSSTYSFKAYQLKIDKYLERPLGKLISEKEKQQLIKNMKQIGYKRAFQHHDFVLWNMFRRGQEIVLADAEFARWGMKWYDIAYFFIQTYIYLQSPRYAQKCLAYFIKRFEQEFPRINIRREIMFPMNYRITANLNESLGNKKLERLARKLLDRILTNDFNQLLR